MISKGKSSVNLSDILTYTSEAEILYHYLGVSKIPCIINSPLREDKNPSFGIYSTNGYKIQYVDFSTRDRGGLFDLLGKLWHCDFKQVLERVYKDMNIVSKRANISISQYSGRKYQPEYKNSELQCKIREWKNHDLEYWSSYGISLKWLKYAEVFPISHKIIVNDNQRLVFRADKYAYAYVEHKEGKTTLKIYQPFNTKFKWCNKHDRSTISLWTKVPEYGDKICICSSLKDALCLWANLGIPSIAVQGEGYKISNTAINELKKRYKEIYICFDNDEPGLKDAQILSQETGFVNIVLPNFIGGKDISDAYKILGKEKWLSLLKPLFTLQDQSNIE